MTSAATVLVLAAAAGLVAFGLRRALIATAALTWRPAPSVQGALPKMLVVCAFRDADEAVTAFVESLAGQHYPSELLEVRLVDDGSSDTTAQRLRAAARQLPNCQVTALDSPAGSGKGFAVKQVLPPLAPTTADVLVVLDADHRLDKDALHRLAGWYGEPSVSAVAFRHAVANAATSPVARYCALESLATEAVHSRGQAALGLVPKLAGAWSLRTGLCELYDPRPGEIADDLRLTAALAAAGARIAYAADVVSTHLVPETVAAYVRQHLRWAQGINSGAVRNCAAVLRSRRAPPRVRLDTALTMLGYGDRALWLLCVAALPGWSAAARLGAVIAMVTGGAAVVYSIAIGLRLEGQRLIDLPRTLLTLSLFPIDVAAVLIGAALGLLGYRIRWETRGR
jgi:glycosyltransferase involved in cell wall biosynthesis